MALQKAITSPNTGVVTNYHRIDGADYGKEKICIRVLSYIDQAARDTGKNAIRNDIIQLDHDLNADIGAANALEHAYGLLKATDAYSGSQDV